MAIRQISSALKFESSFPITAPDFTQTENKNGDSISFNVCFEEFV